MEQLSFTLNELVKCISYRDLIENKLLLPYAVRLVTAENAYKIVKSGKFLQAGVKVISLGNKKGIKFNRIEDKLISKVLEKNIIRSYKIKKINRHQIIRDLIHHLKDASPYNLMRLDIKNFFESIDRNTLIKRLINDGRISNSNLSLLIKYSKAIESTGFSGFPRGISLSAVLAEICLKEIDDFFRKRNDVFYYARFVDDIMIIHHGNNLSKKNIIDFFEKNLPDNLELHKNDKLKYEPISRISNDGNTNKFRVFSFLGYEFKIGSKYSDDDYVFENKNRRVEIDLSKKKTERLKIRVVKAFVSYINSGHTISDYSLLKERLQVLTGNYPIKDPVTGLKIHTGIYYNYQHKNISSECSLTTLDGFIRKILFSSKDRFNARISKYLTLSQRRELSKLTFKNGFDNIRYHTFSYSKLKEIKECWK